jgi:DNA-binding transcriptional regulator YdaS (Cro superfamily)
MELKKYLFDLTPDEREAFAKACKTSVRHLQNVAYGYKPAGESLCINIERETNRQVLCETLRPDVDWAFIRGSKRALSARLATA